MMEWKISRRRFALLPAAASALALPGVLGVRGGAADAQSTDAAQLLTNAAMAMTKLKSFQFELSTVQGQSTILRNLELVGVKGAVERPDRFEATITAKVAIVTVDVDIVGIGAQLWVTDPLAREKSYIQVTGGDEDAAQTEALATLINPDRLLLAAVGLVKAPVIDGTESIDGVQTTRVTGTVDLSTIGALAGATPEAGSVSDLLILGTMPITVWIDGDNHVRSLELEGPLTKDETPDVIRRLDLTDFDEPVDIENPASS
jgi:lipoprotein LprA